MVNKDRAVSIINVVIKCSFFKRWHVSFVFRIIPQLIQAIFIEVFYTNTCLFTSNINTLQTYDAN